MNYPLISEYIEAIKAAEDNFDSLTNLRPVLDEDGEPVMTSGNFAVVFKMKDEQTGALHALKCFLKDQEGRSEAYKKIAEELEYVNSKFLRPIRYLDKELFVDTNTSDETEFPVLLMDWVEGVTLDKYIRQHLDNQYELSLLAYQFSRLAMWLIPQPFAHGDIKPDNIIVKEDGSLVLVDYDGMYVPSMKGQKARELGSPDFRHPLRTEDDFDDHIDDFSLISILLSLKAISLNPSLLEEYGTSDRLLFSEKDYRNISLSKSFKNVFPSDDKELNIIYSLFLLSYGKVTLTVQNIESLKIIEGNLYKRAEAYCMGTKNRNKSYWKDVWSEDELPVEPNKDKAVRLFEDLAIRGCVGAQCCMGCLLWERQTETDKNLAVSWYQMAADNGDTRAVEHIQSRGEKLYKGENGFANYNDAFKMFKIAAEYGDENAILMLGFCYENGIGVPLDLACSRFWYDKIKRGYSAYKIARKYFTGENVSFDYRKAASWLKKAIDMGEVSAYPYLAVCYIDLGVVAYEEKATYLFNKAQCEGFGDLIGDCFDNDDYQLCSFLLIIWLLKLYKTYGENLEDNIDYLLAEGFKEDLEDKGVNLSFSVKGNNGSIIKSIITKYLDGQYIPYSIIAKDTNLKFGQNNNYKYGIVKKGGGYLIGRYNYSQHDGMYFWGVSCKETGITSGCFFKKHSQMVFTDHPKEISNNYYDYIYSIMYDCITEVMTLLATQPAKEKQNIVNSKFFIRYGYTIDICNISNISDQSLSYERILHLSWEDFPELLCENFFLIDWVEKAYGSTFLETALFDKINNKVIETNRLVLSLIKKAYNSGSVS